MGANVGWSYGTEQEYAKVGKALNEASPATLRRFVYAIRAGAGFLDAHQLAFPSVLSAAYTIIDKNWFSEEPMWFGNSVLTPGQIHEVMREARARLAEMLLAGASSVELYICCGYPKLSVSLTWPGAVRADADLTGEAELWAPVDVVDQPVGMWVRTPFNTGYAGAGRYPPDNQWAAGPGAESPPVDDLPSGQAADEEAAAWRKLAEIVSQIDKVLDHAGFTFEDCRSDRNAEAVRQAALKDITPSDLISITTRIPKNVVIFRGTNLCAFGDGNPRPGRSGLSVTFEPALATPPALPDGVERPSLVADGMEDIPWGKRPGITISWG